MWRRSYRLLVTVACAIAAATIALAADGPTTADGPLLELLIGKRALITRAPVQASPVAVVAIDWRSLDAPEFRDIPRALMAPRLAPVLDALFDAGARAVGFDVIFAYSGNHLRPDHDEPFLEALARHRRAVVLARSEVTSPDLSFVAAVGAIGGDGASDVLAFATITPDPDGVSRRVRASPHGPPTPGLAAALLRRAGGPPMPSEVLLAPRTHVERIPTYALVDVVRCAAQHDVLAREFAGRTVIVGGTLPEEDRKVAAGRWLPLPQEAGPVLHPCGLRRLGASAADADHVPGVYLHAATVETVMTGRLTETVSPPVTAALAGSTGAAAAAFGLIGSIWAALPGLLAVGAILFAGALAGLVVDVWIPIAIPLGTLIGAPAVAFVARYLVEERTRRRIQHAFSHFLAPQIVDRLASEPGALRLGGERRDVTVMFADLSGFTALSGKLPPETLTTLTNEYLGYVVEHVEATGGYVDKFIGDAVMAMWGAPAPDTSHASNAVRAAMAAVARIREAAGTAAARNEPTFSVKIGLNSGPAIVGNVGTRRRYNYTAVGETVNVASRLEGVPDLYSTTVVLGPATAEKVSAVFLLRELDVIQVKGREAPLTIWEPIATTAEATAEDHERVRRYAEALALYRARRFADAAAIWDALAKDEGAVAASPPLRMAERARALCADPPPASWTGVFVLTQK